MRLTSTAFDDGGAMPREFTADGTDTSPPLAWSGVPEGTRSMALVCDDPDTPMGTWVHWIIYCIPAKSAGLSEGVPPSPDLPDGVRQGTNDFQRIGFGGPSPPVGKEHHYRFTLYALDTMPHLKAGLTKRELLRAINGTVLAQAHLTATYERRSQAHASRG